MLKSRYLSENVTQLLKKSDRFSIGFHTKIGSVRKRRIEDHDCNISDEEESSGPLQSNPSTLNLYKIKNRAPSGPIKAVPGLSAAASPGVETP